MEQAIYGVLWISVFLFPLIGAYFAVSGGIEREEMREVVYASWLEIVPFFILFLLNNYGLTPYLLLKKKYWQYTVALVFAIGIIFLLVAPSAQKPYSKDGMMKEGRTLTHKAHRNEIIEMREKAREKESVQWNSEREKQEEADERALEQEYRTSIGRQMKAERFMKHAPMPFPLPFFMVRFLIQILTAVLMVGFNIAVKLFFKSVRDQELLKELEHQQLQTELQYLKYQINPHFFMNTLNNIHALVDIDTGKAKSTIMELSKLMRYVLYEASNKSIQLSREIQFLENYVALMRLRFTDKVSIKMNFPLEIPEVQIPPLLFVSFVENAFKHGVSYRKESFIHVCMQLEEGNRLSFRCMNSNSAKADGKHHGIGLENIRKRLRILFGNDYTLSITKDESKFDVLLIIPLLA